MAVVAATSRVMVKLSPVRRVPGSMRMPVLVTGLCPAVMVSRPLRLDWVTPCLAMLQAVKAGQVARIVVYDLTRLARNTRLMLELHLEQLKKQHGWGDLGDTEYRAECAAVRATLDGLPDGDRIVAFDAHRARLLALQEARQGGHAGATGGNLPHRHRAGGHQGPEGGLHRLDAPIRPFFERQRVYPQGALGDQKQRGDDPLAWYAAETGPRRTRPGGHGRIDADATLGAFEAADPAAVCRVAPPRRDIRH